MKVLGGWCEKNALNFIMPKKRIWKKNDQTNERTNERIRIINRHEYTFIWWNSQNNMQREKDRMSEEKKNRAR